MKNKIIFFAIFITLSLNAQAETLIVYANGAFNKLETEIRNNAKIARSKINQETGLRKDLFKFKPILQSDAESIANTWCQDITSGIAQLGLPPPIKYSRNDYYKYYKALGSQYKSNLTLNCPEASKTGSLINITRELYIAAKNNLSSNKKIVFVAHSQGSYFVDAAIGLLVSDIGESVLDRVRVVSFGAVSGVNYLNRYTNLEQDMVVYGDKGALYSGAKETQPYNISGCIDKCIKKATTEEISQASGGENSHRFFDYFSDKVISYQSKKPIYSEISNKVLQSYRELEYFDYIKSKTVKLASIQTSPLASPSQTAKIFEILGIRSAFAEPLPSLFAYINQPYTVRVDGTGFDGNEAVSIDGSTCDQSTLQRGSGYFTQSCTGGSVAGDANKIRVYDTQYDLDIEVPSAYQTMQLRGPVIAPLAPALTEQSSGTIRLTWSAVTGATGYEISRTGQAITTIGSVTTYDDPGRTPGTMYCYRLRAIQNGVLSAYSPESCLTVATLKCQSQWTATQYNPGQTETRALSCQSGYTGNINQTHTCQSTGQWSQVYEQNSCTAIPTPTCTGSWSSTKYLVGQIEEKYENTCPPGTQGQVRSWHTCQVAGSSTAWSGLAQSDNCKAYLATPTGVYASSVSGGVQITWGGVSGATSYNLYKNGNLYRSNLTSTSYIDAYVTNGVTYTYSISAYSNYNSQNVTSPVSGTYSVVYRDGEVGVSPPTDVSASQYTQYSQKGIRLTWTGAPNADSYLIYRRGYSNPYTSATFLAPVGGGSISFNDWMTPGFTGGVVSGQSYCYYIRSVRGSANSIESKEACSIAP